MSTGSDFDDKASRLLSRLTSQPAVKGEARLQGKAPSLQQLGRRWEEFEQSQQESSVKMGELSQNLAKFEQSLRQENEGRKRMDESFGQAASRMETTMKKVMTSMQSNLCQREKKLQERIDSLLRSEKRELQSSLKQGDDILEQMSRLEAKVEAISEEVVELKKARTMNQSTASEQFSKQIRELRGIFQRDIRNRQEKEERAMETLRRLYRAMTERMRSEDMERQESEQVLMGVVQRLVDHIVDA